MEKKKRHSWSIHNSRFATCKVCGCKRDRSSLTPVYRLNDERFEGKSPSCLTPSNNNKS